MIDVMLRMASETMLPPPGASKVSLVVDDPLEWTFSEDSKEVLVREVSTDDRSIILCLECLSSPIEVEFFICFT